MRDENEVRPPRGEPRILLGQAEDVRRGLMARIPGVSIIVLRMFAEKRFQHLRAVDLARIICIERFRYHS